MPHLPEGSLLRRRFDDLDTGHKVSESAFWRWFWMASFSFANAGNFDAKMPADDDHSALKFVAELIGNVLLK